MTSIIEISPLYKYILTIRSQNSFQVKMIPSGHFSVIDFVRPIKSGTCENENILFTFQT